MSQQIRRYRYHGQRRAGDGFFREIAEGLRWCARAVLSSLGDTYA